jgi:hypothetical protein
MKKRTKIITAKTVLTEATGSTTFPYICGLHTVISSSQTRKRFVSVPLMEANSS